MVSRSHEIANSPDDGDDGGFVLLESIVSISLIIIVMAGLTNFFVTVTNATNQLRARQSATVVADGALDQIRGLQQSSDIYLGRTAAAVTAQFSSAPSQVAPLLTRMNQVFDPPPGSPAKVPMTAPAVQINNISYVATNYVGSCVVPIDSASGTDCLPATPCDSSSGTNCSQLYDPAIALASFLRVVVAVSWSDSHCPSSTCVYSTTTLLSNAKDPNFLLHQTPPAAPVVTNPGAQTSAIGDTVSLQMALAANSGINPITWSTPNSGAGSLPVGLSISSSGLISGSPDPTDALGTTPVSVTAIDGFGRLATQSINWTILPNLVPTGPATWGGTVNVAITNITLSATGGSGAPFTWSVPAAGQANALPAGLSLTSAGVISGTPTAPVVTTSLITVADSSGRTRTLSTDWSVYALSTVTMAGTAITLPQNWTASNQPVAYTCPTAKCTLTLTGAPTGLGVSLTNAGAGSTSVNVTATSGTVYLVGTITNAAASFAAVTLTPKDTTYTKTGTADSQQWTVTAAGTAFTTPLSVLRTFQISPQKLNYSCVAACQVSFTSSRTAAPATTLSGVGVALTASSTIGASINEPAGTGNFYVRGTAPIASSTGAYTVTVTITEPTGTAVSTVATWNVS